MRAIGSVLDGLLRDLHLADGVQGWQAVEAWPAAVGPRIARRTRAVGFRDGILTVEVEGSAWRYELGFLKRRLLLELRRRTGSARVRELHFIHARGGIRR